jgi:HSP20 family protein
MSTLETTKTCSNTALARAPEETQATATRREAPILTVEPDIDLIERADRFLLTADLPGVRPEDIELELHADVLTLRGTAEAPNTEGFRAQGDLAKLRYERRFKLSQQLDRESIEATSKDGVLSVSLRKTAPAQARKIDVRFA